MLIQISSDERLQQREVFVTDTPLTEVDKFSIDMELTNRIQSAAAAFGN